MSYKNNLYFFSHKCGRREKLAASKEEQKRMPEDEKNLVDFIILV